MSVPEKNIIPIRISSQRKKNGTSKQILFIEKDLSRKHLRYYRRLCQLNTFSFAKIKDFYQHTPSFLGKVINNMYFAQLLLTWETSGTTQYPQYTAP